MTRAMFAQAIANMEGVDLDMYRQVTPTFDDVSSTAWYFAAVEWAARMGIVSGVGDGRFDPNSHITREQMAVMLYRYAQVRNIPLPVAQAERFADFDTVSVWARNGVEAIQSAGFIGGRGDGRFDPLATATRAEVATIFARFIVETEITAR